MFTIKDSIIVDYERVLAGQLKRLPNTYFRGSAYNKEANAVTVIRYALSNCLGLSANEALLMINDDMLRKLKIINLIKYIRFPYGIRKDAYFYVVFLAYPGEFPNIKEQTALYIYKKVLTGEYRIPANFFDGEEGKENAITVLSYQLPFLGLEGYELYKFFYDGNYTDFLKQSKLKNVIGKCFSSPLDWVHESALESSELWYRYFKYLEFKSEKDNNNAVVRRRRSVGVSDNL